MKCFNVTHSLTIILLYAAVCSVHSRPSYSPLSSKLDGINENFKLHHTLEHPHHLEKHPYVREARSTEFLQVGPHPPVHTHDDLSSFATKIADLYGLDGDSLSTTVSSTSLGSGITIATIKRVLGGIEVFGDELTVLITPDGTIRSVSGSFSNATSVDGQEAHQSDELTALHSTFADFGHGVLMFNNTRRTNRHDNAVEFSQQQGGGTNVHPHVTLHGPATVERTFFPSQGVAKPAWKVQAAFTYHPPQQHHSASSSSVTHAYSSVVDASSSTVLFRKAHHTTKQSTHRLLGQQQQQAVQGAAKIRTQATGPVSWQVLASSPTGMPRPATQFMFEPFDQTDTPTVPTVGPTTPYPFQEGTERLHLDNHVFLQDGTKETRGSHIDGFWSAVDGSPSFVSMNSDSNNGDTGFIYAYDFRNSRTTTLHDLSQAETNAAVVNAFYEISWLEQWIHHTGWSSLVGHHSSGSSSSKLQVSITSSVDEPAAVYPSGFSLPSVLPFAEGSFSSSVAYITVPGLQEPLTAVAFRQSLGGVKTSLFSSYEVTGEVVLWPSDSPASGCVSTQANIEGKVVLVEAGGCPNEIKVQNALQGGSAVAIIIIDTPLANQTNEQRQQSFYQRDHFLEHPVPTTGALIVPFEGIGEALSTAAGSSSVVVTVSYSAVWRQSAMDVGYVAEKFGVFVVERLSNNVVGAPWDQSTGVRLGWSVFFSSLLIASQASVTSFHLQHHAFPRNTWWEGNKKQGAGFYPLSYDKRVNPLTLEHLTNTTLNWELNSFSGSSAGIGSVLTPSHIGEVWTATLWQVFVSLVVAPGGGSGTAMSKDSAINVMKEAMVLALTITPHNSDLLEARDGLITALLSVTGGDKALITNVVWPALTARGFGPAATVPRYTVSVNNKEEWHVQPDTTTQQQQRLAIAVDFYPEQMELISDCDSDGRGDAGEVAKWFVPFTLRRALVEADIIPESLSLTVQIQDQLSAHITEQHLTYHEKQNWGLIAFTVKIADEVPDFTEVEISVVLSRGPESTTARELRLEDLGVVLVNNEKSLYMYVQADREEILDGVETFIDGVPNEWHQENLVFASYQFGNIDLPYLAHPSGIPIPNDPHYAAVPIWAPYDQEQQQTPQGKNTVLKAQPRTGPNTPIEAVVRTGWVSVPSSQPGEFGLSFKHMYTHQSHSMGGGCGRVQMQVGSSSPSGWIDLMYLVGRAELGYDSDQPRGGWCSQTQVLALQEVRVVLAGTAFAPRMYGNKIRFQFLYEVTAWNGNEEEFWIIDDVSLFGFETPSVFTWVQQQPTMKCGLYGTSPTKGRDDDSDGSSGTRASPSVVPSSSGCGGVSKRGCGKHARYIVNFYSDGSCKDPQQQEQEEEVH